MTATILQGDCLSVLATLPDQSVQCCVTSPPYYGLRDYGVEGQIGLEETPDQYVAKLVAVFREVRRVLRDDGTLWLNLGDSYIGGKGKSGSRGADIQEDRYAKGNTLNRGYQTMGEHGITKPTDDRKLLRQYGIKPKDLIGIPWMVAFALRADGWYLRQDIIWHKPNPMPESVKDRCTKAHEYIFLLAKSQKYYYDYQAVLEPAAFSSITRVKYGLDCDRANISPKGNGSIHVDSMGDRFLSRRLPPIGGKKHVGKNGNPTYSGNTPEIQRMGKDGSGFAGHSGNYDKDGNLLTHEKDGIPARNKRSVWTVTTKPFKGAHFATFPPDLIEPCILAGSAKGDTVLDPFNGAGTTGMVALKHGREYIGIELNPDYVEMTHKRLASVQVEL